SATPTAAGTPQPIPPLAVAKNDPLLTVGSHSICWAMVEGGPVQQRGAVDGGAQLLRQGDGRVPPAGAVHLRSEDQRGTAAGRDAVGEQPLPGGEYRRRHSTRSTQGRPVSGSSRPREAKASADI